MVCFWFPQFVPFGILIWKHALILKYFTAADQTSAMQEQMSGAAGSMPQDPKAAFKAEWEALEITEYENVLQNVDSHVFSAISESL